MIGNITTTDRIGGKDFETPWDSCLAFSGYDRIVYEKRKNHLNVRGSWSSARRVGEEKPCSEPTGVAGNKLMNSMTTMLLLGQGFSPNSLQSGCMM